MDNGSKLPNVSIEGNTSSLSWLNIINDSKLILILDYLYINQSRCNNKVKCCLDDIIISCGCKPNNHKGCMNDKFKSTLSALQSMEVIKCKYDLLKVKPTQFIIIEYNCIDVNSEGEEINWYYLLNSARDKIINYKEVNIDNYNLLNVYCYINKKIKKSNNNIQCTGGKSESCFFTYDTVSSALGFSERSYSKYISILKKLKLIDYGNIGKVIDKRGNISNANNVYVLTSSDDYKHNLKEGLKESKYFYENLGWTVK